MPARGRLAARLEELAEPLSHPAAEDPPGLPDPLPALQKALRRMVDGLSVEQLAAQIAELERAEAEAAARGAIELAERLSAETRELREKQVLVKNSLLVEQSQRAFDQLRAFNREQIAAFNARWDAAIAALLEQAERAEAELLAQQQGERERLEEAGRQAHPPAARFSATLLNEQFRVQQMVRARRYEAAKETRESAVLRETAEREQWRHRLESQLVRRREQLAAQHALELSALQTRLEKTAHASLKQRAAELTQLRRRMHNLQSETVTRQTAQFAKIQAQNAKLLSKFSISLSAVEERSAYAPPPMRKSASLVSAPGGRRGRWQTPGNSSELWSQTQHPDSSALGRAKRKVARAFDRSTPQALHPPRASFTTLSSSGPSFSAGD